MNETPFFWYYQNHTGLPLHLLVETGNNLLEVRKLLQSGEDPNQKSGTENTPLHLAVLNVAENGPIVEALIAAGADVNAKNCYKNTALDFAIIYRKHAVIEILLRAGADVNRQDIYGNTPLHYAIKNCILFRKMHPRFECSESNKYVDFWIVEKLLQHDAKVNVRNTHFQTPLYLAIDVGNLHLIRMLFNNGASANFYDSKYGNSLLRIVLKKRRINLGIVCELLRHGAKVDCDEKNTISNWHLAIEKYFSTPWWDHENAKVLMKSFVLFTTEYRTFRMPRATTPRTEEFLRFYHKCTFEAEVIKSDVITLKYTVFDFVTNNSVENQDSRQLERNACDYVFSKLKKGIYVVYVDEILNRIGRSYLTEEFIKTKVYVKVEKYQGKVCLDRSCLQQISLYLSLSDMFNFILAKSKYNWFNTRKVELKRNVLRVLHTYAPDYMKSFILRLL